MKSFFCTLAITLCAILLASGLLWADVHTRAVTFDSSTPPYMVRQTAEAELPLPVAGEVLRYLYRGEKAILKYLLQKTENIT